MAIENLVTPNLGRRWVITGVFGLAHGFGFSFFLQEQLQFAGGHLLVLLIALPALALLFRGGLVNERLDSVILSILVAHTAWHWMVDRAASLRTVEWPLPEPASPGALAFGAGLLLIAGGLTWFLVSRLRNQPASPPRTEEGDAVEVPAARTALADRTSVTLPHALLQ